MDVINQIFIFDGGWNTKKEDVTFSDSFELSWIARNRIRWFTLWHFFRSRGFPPNSPWRYIGRKNRRKSRDFSRGFGKIANIMPKVDVCGCERKNIARTIDGEFTQVGYKLLDSCFAGSRFFFLSRDVSVLQFTDFSCWTGFGYFYSLNIFDLRWYSSWEYFLFFIKFFLWYVACKKQVKTENDSNCFESWMGLVR